MEKSRTQQNLVLLALDALRWGQRYRLTYQPSSGWRKGDRAEVPHIPQGSLLQLISSDTRLFGRGRNHMRMEHPVASNKAEEVTTFNSHASRYILAALNAPPPRVAIR